VAAPAPQKQYRLQAVGAELIWTQSSLLQSSFISTGVFAFAGCIGRRADVYRCAGERRSAGAGGRVLMGHGCRHPGDPHQPCFLIGNQEQ